MEARIFKTKNKAGEEVVLKFIRPTQVILSKADLKSKEAYSNAFRKGLLTNAEVIKYLRERDIWTTEMEEETMELRVKINDLEEKLKDQSLSNEDGMAVVDEIKMARAKLADHNANIRSIADNTCESNAAEARNQFLAASCVVNAKSGVKVFKDIDDFLSRLDEPLTIDAYREAVISNLEDQLNVSLPSDLTSHYPENKWTSERKARAEVEAEAAEAEKAEVVEVAPEQAEKKSRKKGSVTL